MEPRLGFGAMVWNGSVWYDAAHSLAIADVHRVGCPFSLDFTRATSRPSFAGKSQMPSEKFHLIQP